MSKRIIVVFVGIFLFLGILYFLGIISIKKPCGIGMQYVEGIIMPGKEWNCVCVGKVDKVFIENSTVNYNYYCTGLNFSYNKLTSFLNEGRQYPVYIR